MFENGIGSYVLGEPLVAEHFVGYPNTERLAMRANKDLAYMFLVKYTSQNRIVCKVPSARNPKVLFVGTYTKDGVYSHVPSEGLGVPSPRQISVKTVEELKKLAMGCDHTLIQGYICYLKGTGAPIKIHNPTYKDLFDVRGNEASICFRYIQLRKNPAMVAKLYSLYPHLASKMDQYEKYISTAAEIIHDAYIIRYIDKGYIVRPPEEFYVMKQCHTWHVKDRHNNRISLLKVKEFLDLQSATNINRIIRRIRFDAKNNSYSSYDAQTGAGSAGVCETPIEVGTLVDTPAQTDVFPSVSTTTEVCSPAEAPTPAGMCGAIEGSASTTIQLPVVAELTIEESNAYSDDSIVDTYDTLLLYSLPEKCDKESIIEDLRTLTSGMKTDHPIIVASKWLSQTPEQDVKDKLDILKRLQPYQNSFEAWCEENGYAKGMISADNYLFMSGLVIEPYLNYLYKVSLLRIYLCHTANALCGVSPHLSAVPRWDPCIAVPIFRKLYPLNYRSLLLEMDTPGFYEGKPIELGTSDILLTIHQNKCLNKHHRDTAPASDNIPFSMNFNLPVWEFDDPKVELLCAGVPIKTMDLLLLREPVVLKAPSREPPCLPESIE
jgi:hypothetical protein